MTDKKRRTEDVDRTTQEIETLILQEDDPKQRAFLIVLNTINKSLLANTHTLREFEQKLEEHTDKFADHAKTEEALMNKGRGMWKVAAWVIGVAQIAGLYIWQHAREDLASINTSMQRNQVEMAQINLRVTNVEKVLEARK